MSKPNQQIFFIDRSIGKHKVADALRNAGELVKVHDDRFPQNTKDQDWLPTVAAEDRIILTADQRILNRPLEIEAVRNSKAKLFVYSSKEMTGEAMSSGFLAAADKIKEIAMSRSNYLIVKVYKNGSIMEVNK